MTTFQIVALYVAICLLMNPVLMLRVGRMRMAKKINLGDGDDADMVARIRAHGNFTEVAPLGLIGLIAIAMLGGSPMFLHLFGGLLVIGRILHALGMSGTFGQGRFVGTLMTLLLFVGEALYLFYLIFLHGPV